MPRLARAGILLSALVSVALAQDQTTDDEIIEEIVVTGYHVKRTSTDGPAPVVVFTREDLEAAGINTLNEFAQYIPYNSLNLSDYERSFNITAGAANFNLRGLGHDATLTLINGRRIAPYGTAENGGTELFVDINSIPLTAIERVEILKDGASAIYGSDAVAGVVNIILKRSYEGFELDAGYLTDSEGDLDETTVSLTAGWQQESTSLMGILSWFDRSPLWNRDRDFLESSDFRSRGGPDLRSAFSSPPSIINLEDGTRSADPECPEERVVIDVTGRERCRFDFLPFTPHILASERLAGGLFLDHEFGPRLSLYAELIASRNESETNLAPAALNLFVPASHPDSPFPGDELFVGYRSVDTGLRTTDVDNTAIRTVVGLTGSIADWQWDAGLNWSRNEVERDGNNFLFDERVQEALEGMGGPNQDQFLNPFGLDPQNDPALLASLTASITDREETEEWSGDLLFTTDRFELANGPLTLALGGQLRHQQLDEDIDPLTLSGEVGGGRIGSEIHEDRDIWALFGETTYMPLASLELQLAVRHEHYDDFGGTTDPKIAALWQPAESWLVRASYGTSFRAPSFRELFDPVVQDTLLLDEANCAFFGIDPCPDDFVTISSAGNPDLDPDEGESWLLGVMWLPATPEGLSIGIDFWRFEHDDRIVFVGDIELLQTFCPECFVRAPQTPEEAEAGIPGKLVEIQSTWLNADKLTTQGVDVDLGYRWTDRGGGLWELALSHTYLDKYEFDESLEFEAGSDFAGRTFLHPLPEHRGNLTFGWTRNAHHIAAILHYVDEFEADENLWIDGEETEQPFKVDDWQSLDVQYEYTFARFGNPILRIGCQNCTDENPPTANSFATLGSALHDKRGQVWYLRWTQPFGQPR